MGHIGFRVFGFGLGFASLFCHHENTSRTPEDPQHP